MSFSSPRNLQALALFALGLFGLLLLWPTNRTSFAQPLAATVRVPEDVSDIQSAISIVPDGGIIEIASGTYFVPPGGFVISDLQKGFTLQARNGAPVVFDGQGQHVLIRFINSDRSRGKPVTFVGITFANGYSGTDGWAGGVTLQRAEATFINCKFLNNQGNQPSTGGGGVLVAEHSQAVFQNCTWQGNTARNYGGGLAVETSSEAHVLSSTFTGNRVNLPGHAVTAAGGAVHVGNSSLWVYKTNFQDNEAGYVGGAIYAIGTWTEPLDVPRTILSVTFSNFENNKAQRDPSVSFPLPTEGGAVHVEDQTLATIYRSTFIRNSAMVGGAVNNYRASAIITASYFRGNTAVGVGPANGFGGAISTTSDDTSADGTSNRPVSSFIVKDTVIVGEFKSQAGNGIYAAGDRNRMYGQNGTIRMGSVEENRAQITLENVIIYNTDVQETPGAPGTGVGGGILVDLADLTMNNVLIMDADAFGATNGSGGGLVALNQSKVVGTRVFLFKNSAEKYGGGVFVQGSEIYLSQCTLAENSVSPGTNETIYFSFGAALFTMPDVGRGLPVSGAVENCTITRNDGLPIYDYDRSDGPINAVQYNGNIIYNETFGSQIYRNSIISCCQTVDQLNTLVIYRNNGTSSVKSARDNIGPSSQPSAGAILAAPPFLFPKQTSPYYIGVAWSGQQAQLNNTTIAEQTSLFQDTAPKTYTLLVDNASFTIDVPLLDKQVFLPLLSR